MIVDVERRELASGIPVFIAPQRALPLVDLEVVFQPGAALDAGDTAGRISLTCEMLEEGTTTRSAVEIAEQVEFLGGYIDVQPTHDAICAAVHVQSERLEQALDVAADVLINPIFDAREFQRKQGEHIRALRQELDDAEAMAARAFATGVFGAEHPYGVPIAGTEAALRTFTPTTLRVLHEEVFRADNAFIVAVGDIDADRLMRALESRFALIKRGNQTERPALPMPQSTARRVLLVDKPGAQQAELRVGHVAPERGTSDYFALVVLNAILGGSFTSRLNTILRERMGVTYGAGSRFRLRRDGGIFSSAAAVFTESAARSAQVMVEEMERLQQERVGAEELLRAQRYIALGLPRSFESTTDVATHLREQIVQELPADYWNTYVERVMTVSADDVQRAATRHLQPDRCTIVVAADASQVREALEQSSLGEVTLTDVQA